MLAVTGHSLSDPAKGPIEELAFAGRLSKLRRWWVLFAGVHLTEPLSMNKASHPITDQLLLF